MPAESGKDSRPLEPEAGNADAGKLYIYELYCYPPRGGFSFLGGCPVMDTLTGGGFMQHGDTLTVNGKPHPFTAGMTISSLLAELMDGPATVVVELNGTIVPRGEFGETTLATGDSIEIVHFVGGG